MGNKKDTNNDKTKGDDGGENQNHRTGLPKRNPSSGKLSTSPAFLQKDFENDPIFVQECAARDKALKNPILLPLINMLATVVIFVVFLVSLEMILSVALTVGLTIVFYNRLQEDPQLSAQSLNLTLLSFTVVSPIISLVSLAFKRREDALYAVADLRATLQQLYIAHAIWDWDQKPGVTDDSGRIRSSVNWLDHSDEVAREVFRLAYDMARFLTLPNSSRGRHRVTYWGRQEAARTNAVGAELFQAALVHLGRLSDLCEILKREGLPGNEAARIRQFERFLQVNMEKLRVIKLYRTPQGLRSFGRLFSVILPPFFAPFFAEISVQMGTMVFGIIFAVITAGGLTGLFETVIKIEDPFLSASRLDGVKVYEELVERFAPQVLKLRMHYFPNADEFMKCQTDEDIKENLRLTEQVFSARIMSES